VPACAWLGGVGGGGGGGGVRGGRPGGGVFRGRYPRDKLIIDSELVVWLDGHGPGKLCAENLRANPFSWVRVRGVNLTLTPTPNTESGIAHVGSELVVWLDRHGPCEFGAERLGEGPVDGHVVLLAPGHRHTRVVVVNLGGTERHVLGLILKKKHAAEVCVCMYVCIHTSLSLSLNIYISTYICICTYLSIHISIFIYIYELTRAGRCS